MILTTQCFNKKVKKNMHVMAKPIGAKCNLDCQYCYYLSKEELLADRLGACEQMNEESLEAYIKQYFAAHNVPQVNFSWQGGEPTMLGLDYFRTVVRLQKKYCPKDVEVLNDLQTNGTLLNDEWCQFLAKHQFLVGISIDGDEMLHNTYRTNRAGRGTWQQVMGAIELLKKHEVSFCTLTCVNRLTSQSSLEVYRFLRDVVQSPLIQFIPIVEPKTFRTQSPQASQCMQGDPRLSPSHPDSIVEHWSVEAKDWGSFLKTVFDEWYRYDVGRVHVQYFEALFATWMGEHNPLCTLGEMCGKGLAIEPNGDVYRCDHFVYPDYLAGNIHQSSLDEMAFSAAQQAFGYAKSKSLTAQCRACPYQFACFGECPKNRIISSSSGERGHNYLCEGWYDFFRHIDEKLAHLLRVNSLPVKHGQFKTNKS
ncbi:Anaerobic sulfatase-maturating enzyme homolog AslB [Vibrio crassostreae]|uniref:anaerobic sulfatase maturase n=1 Tax=Vibrio crassostreae TaxID=246167 RepID=UPI0005E091D7|nr:anaerobic sulfatase maturase [Vibrio crassostreae]TCT66226.1 uncharacterized protein EDB44_102282 [Vibrio crassostreae]TCT75050.1 uncharacterized protein EDB46_105118 [Vibrio crassostreae]TCT86289.1 uncharacterized protein EDB43_102282 [Vibrio crassostreae]TCU08808.1 uncharacterized protein EDB47_101121 [Vibrio crassostreae]TDW11534.1 uncharacterized protein EDB45_103120 [Vibrio crassostreae]